jgi:hypothetical protein
MQQKALGTIRKLILLGVDKFIMQKEFSIIHELVPLLAREDPVQQVCVCVCIYTYLLYVCMWSILVLCMYVLDYTW